MMQLTSLLLLAVATSGYALYKRYLEVHHDSREPPLVPQKIPVIGHSIGLLRKSVYYFVSLRYYQTRRSLTLSTRV